MKRSSFLSFRYALPILCALSALLSGSGSRAAELLMFEREGCVYCTRWNTEVAPAYALSNEAKRAPLRRIDLGKGQPKQITLAAPVRYTPTFVLVDNGKEVGRITGYFDNAIFWGMLEKMIRTSLAK